MAGEKPGRETDDERVYFNAVGLAFVDVAIALAMYRRAVEAGKGRELTMQETMIFDHPEHGQYVRGCERRLPRGRHPRGGADRAAAARRTGGG